MSDDIYFTHVERKKETSRIKYDRDHPHEMRMVFIAWAENNDHLNSEATMIVYDEWVADKVRLMIDQKAWSRIVATYL